MPHLRAEITPSVLRWARERSRYDIKTLSKRLNVSVERYEEWEEGRSQPTFKQLRKAANVLNRPLGLFFLPEPPPEKEVLSELRRLPGVAPIESPSLAEAVRIAAERREKALELFNVLDDTPPSINIKINMASDPEEVSVSVREVLGVTMEDQASWPDSNTALRNWREALQNDGVLVFQIPSIPISEMRGFSIASRPLPVVAYNSADSSRGRIFTIMHELTHVLLGESVLDSGQAGSHLYAGNAAVELFCNRVAASILVPNGDLLGHQLVRLRSTQGLWHDKDVQQLSSYYHVSKAVVVRRLREFDLIAHGVYESLREEYDSYMPDPESRKSSGSYYNNKLAWLGTLIPRLAFDAYGADRITSTDVAAIMGAKVKHLGKFEEKLRGYNLYFPV